MKFKNKQYIIKLIYQYIYLEYINRLITLPWNKFGFICSIVLLLFISWCLMKKQFKCLFSTGIVKGLSVSRK